MWRFGLIYLLLCTIHCDILAQNVVFTVTPSTTKLGLDDEFQLDYTVTDVHKLISITPAISNDFIVVQGPFQSQSFHSATIGDKTINSHNVSLTYILRPKHEGSFIILPAVAKDADGIIYQSNPINIQVVSGTLSKSKLHILSQKYCNYNFVR